MVLARLGLNVAPDWETQRLLAPLYTEVDYLELLPESLVAPWSSEAFVPNDFCRAAQEL